MAVTLYTFNDMVEHLADTYDVQRAGRLLRNCRRAVLMAYRELPHAIRWKYYDRRFVMQTVAPQSTGTISYDHTGGTNERELTLTGATWPSGVERYRINIGRSHYSIDSSISSTVVTLADNSNPGADVTSGTPYILYKSHYRLPSTFRKIGKIYDVDNELSIGIIDTDEQLTNSTYVYDTPNQPLWASIRADGEFYNELKLIFSPPPDTAREYDITYEAKARPLKIEKHVSGTASITAGSATVTGSATAAFTAGMVDSVIRFSADGNTLPTSVLGDIQGNTNLFAEQGVVKSFTNATTMTLTENASQTLSSVKYMVSDPIDIEADAMMTAFHRLMESEYERLARLKTRQESYAAYRQALIQAMEADQRSTTAGRTAGYNLFRNVRKLPDIP